MFCQYPVLHTFPEAVKIVCPRCTTPSSFMYSFMILFHLPLILNMHELFAADVNQQTFNHTYISMICTGFYFNFPQF